MNLKELIITTQQTGRAGEMAYFKLLRISPSQWLTLQLTTIRKFFHISWSAYRKRIRLLPVDIKRTWWQVETLWRVAIGSAVK